MNTRLLAMVREAGKDADPVQALHRLLLACVEGTSASCGRLYLLNLATSAYERVSQTGDAAPAPDQFPVSVLEPGARPSSPLERAVVTRKIVSHPPPGHGRGPTEGRAPGSQLVVPIVRQDTCLGAIDLSAGRADHFNATHEEVAECAAAIALILADRGHTLKLLKALPEPIKLNQPFDNFLDDLINLVALASGMPFLALRELTDGEPPVLECLRSYGFPGPPDAMTISAEVEPLRTVAQTSRPVAERSMSAPHLADLRQIPQLAPVRSFVIVPVMVGENLYGTLSFSSSCEYDYTDLEVSGFLTIANAVGVSLSNYRAVHEAADNIYKASQVNAAITSLEIAQAARHEIIDRTAESTEAVMLIRGTVAGSPSREDLQRVRKKAEEVVDALRKINQVINNIKTVTKPPAREWKQVSIRDLWEETFDLFHGRLATLGIKRTVGGDAQAEVVPDYLRHVFLHLLLNSVDAFKERRQKSNRLITVAIDPQSDQAVNVHIRYTDNATGIDPSRLLNLPPSQTERAPVAGDIFMPGVTSKSAQGSGYGLYLAQRVLKEHKGTLALTDHRGGVVFDITLPKSRPQHQPRKGGDGAEEKP